MPSAVYTRSLIVSRAISGATTVVANGYAIVTYAYSSSSNSPMNGSTGPDSIVTRYFGPGQSIPASFSSNVPVGISTGNPFATVSATWTIQTGVEFVNG